MQTQPGDRIFCIISLILRQISFGFYVSPDNFEPKEPLQCNKNDHIKSLKHMQQLQVVTLEPIGDIIKSA